MGDLRYKAAKSLSDNRFEIFDAANAVRESGGRLTADAMDSVAELMDKAALAVYAQDTDKLADIRNTLRELTERI